LTVGVVLCWDILTALLFCIALRLNRTRVARCVFALAAEPFEFGALELKTFGVVLEPRY
jgi:hypothetical protein